MDGKIMGAVQFNEILARYRETYKRKDLGEARRLNQTIYEDMFSTYQYILRMPVRTPDVTNSLNKVFEQLEILREEGISIITQQNKREENK